MEHFAHGAISPTVKIAATAKDIKENGGPAIVHPLFPVERECAKNEKVNNFYLRSD